MALRPDILKHLAASKNLAVERTIEMTLPHATAEEQQQLADVLLQRDRRAGWVTLIRAFDRLNEALQERLIGQPRELFGPLSEALQDSEGPARKNVIQIIRRCGDLRMVNLLAQALMDNRDEVRGLAGQALLESVRRYRKAPLAEGSEANGSAEASAQLAKALEFGLRQFRTHRQAPAVMAALICERQHETHTWAYFHDANEGLTRCATTILRQPAEPALASATLLALGSKLKSAGMAGLSSAEAPEICAALAAESYRLLDPALREGAMAIGHLRMFGATDGNVPWNAETWPVWLRLLENVGIAGPVRVAWLTRMLTDAAASADLGWRVATMRALTETGQTEAFAAILSMANDADERAARFAARCVLDRRNSEWRLAAGVLLRSPHLSVRKLVSMRNVGGEDFGALWHDYSKMPPAVQFVSAREASTTKEDFPQKLRKKLGSTQTMEVAQGLRMLNSLQQVNEYRAEIIGLCGHADARIAAIAVKLIGRLEDPRLRDLLEAAAHHEDARVRANAIESMAALRIADRSQQVMAMLNSRHNRERANAIKALSQFDFATARECLARMLTDQNPVHRMSALWVVGQLQLLEIVRQVHSTARRDPNARVRATAAEMLTNITNVSNNVAS